MASRRCSSKGPGGRPGKRLRLEDLDSSSGDINVNTDHYSAVVRAYNTIIEHHLFETILDDKPLPIQGNRESGYEAVYDAASYSSAIKERGLYKSSGNIMWVDMLWSAQSGVPINTSAVAEIIEYYFEDQPWECGGGELRKAPESHEGSHVRATAGEPRRATRRLLVMTWHQSGARTRAPSLLRSSWRSESRTTRWSSAAS